MATRKQSSARHTQPALPGLGFSARLSFGGSLLEGRRKDARPFDSKRALHVVLRSTQATGERSLLRHKRKIDETLAAQARLHGVKIYAQANAGNHLHLVLKAHRRNSLRSFLRAMSGLIARTVLGRQRGPARPLSTSPTKNTPFWDARPFSRIVAWGKAFSTLTRYVHQNRMEAVGFTRPEARDILAVCDELGLDPPIS